MSDRRIHLHNSKNAEQFPTPHIILQLVPLYTYVSAGCSDPYAVPLRILPMGSLCAVPPLGEFQVIIKESVDVPTRGICSEIKRAILHKLHIYISAAGIDVQCSV